MSRLGKGLVALVILCLVGAVPLAYLLGPLRACLAGWTGEEELRPQLRSLYSLPISALRHIETAPHLPIAQTGVNPYGVNVFLEQEVEEAKIRRILSMIKGAGFGWIRQQFPWRDIEIPRKGEFWDTKWNKDSWEKYDRIVKLANEYGLEIIARLDAPPDWSRQDNRRYNRPPDNFADFGDFVHTIVSRYRGKVHYYQIWNEPNIYPEWGEQPVDPAGYVRLLRIAYERAKEADPDCVILSAGLAPTTEQGPKNLSDLTFLEEMYRTGAKDYFDIMSVMGYGLWTGPSDRRAEPERTNFSRPMLIRQIMVRYGDGTKPIWASEVGWNALSADFPGQATFGRVSEGRQASYTVQAYRRSQAEWPWMGVMCYWFFKRADEHERGQPMYYFRMVEPDFTPLPVYDAMAELAGEHPRMYPGFHQEDHWAIGYWGDWPRIESSEATLGGYRVGRKVGDGLTFTFHGTDLALVVGPGTQGQLLVRLDGRKGRITLPASPAGKHIRLARGLPARDHEVALEILPRDEGQDSPCLEIDGFIVERGQHQALRRAGSLLALVGMLVFLFYQSGRRREEVEEGG